MSNYSRRALTAYYMHGHVHPGGDEQNSINYSELFYSLHEASESQKIYEYRDRFIAVTNSIVLGEKIAFLFVSGDEDGSMLTLDLKTLDAQTQEAGKNRLFVQSRWVIVDANDRIAVMENKRPTVGMDEVTRFLELYSNELFQVENSEFNLNQVADPGFIDRIEGFTRIREASVVLNRPNSSWTDSANDLVSSTASGGASDIEVSARASRNQSLSKDEGIVKEIKDLVSKGLSFVKNAKITGLTSNSEGETTLSLKDSPVKDYANIRKGAVPAEQLAQLESTALGVFEQAKSVGESRES